MFSGLVVFSFSARSFPERKLLQIPQIIIARNARARTSPRSRREPWPTTGEEEGKEQQEEVKLP